MAGDRPYWKTFLISTFVGGLGAWGVWQFGGPGWASFMTWMIVGVNIIGDLDTPR